MLSDWPNKSAPIAVSVDIIAANILFEDLGDQHTLHPSQTGHNSNTIIAESLAAHCSSSGLCAPLCPHHSLLKLRSVRTTLPTPLTAQAQVFAHHSAHATHCSSSGLCAPLCPRFSRLALAGQLAPTHNGGWSLGIKTTNCTCGRCMRRSYSRGAPCCKQVQPWASSDNSLTTRLKRALPCRTTLPTLHRSTSTMAADGDKIKLTYWDAAGRGEAVRVALRVAGIQFTDERIKSFAGQAHCTALHRRLLCKHQLPCPPSESPPSPLHQLQAALPPAFAWGWPRVHAQESVIDLLGQSTRV
jgi:hypothetical protein